MGDPSHSDYFVQIGVSDFSLSYAVGVSSNPLISPSSSLLGISLKSMEILYFNNLSCPLCPVASSEVVLSIDMNSLGIRSSSLPSYGLISRLSITCDSRFVPRTLSE